ncbi:YjjG family noncanonical pyrimidine nucleotidase [Anaerococcus sp. Marseille-Q7828]|uniref:YjjG family noncanonical pyrimidine nucleotidase n=1 Tax=Anaerococcus sp. Marseille-Q7828 TaxID=3036300 RepID=UPI0024AE60D8|nr:YjjG family noncanonical pyrimidine nucleotidase [Anaerococcus sp. Marseille-Q7828]
MIKYLLWDIDNTLLSFDLAERASMTKGFDKFGLDIDDEKALDVYKNINDKYWKMLEKGEKTREEILTERFEEFFDLYDIAYDDRLVNDFNLFYQEELGKQVFFNDYAEEVLQKLGKDYKQYAVTNGSKVAQSGKLKNSGLDKIFDGVFISEDLGYDKPSLEYFDLVFENIGSKNRDEYILIGDSLTSDMLGSNNAGIRNIWYNPKDLDNDIGIRIDYTIHQLNKVVDILDDLR